MVPVSVLADPAAAPKKGGAWPTLQLLHEHVGHLWMSGMDHGQAVCPTCPIRTTLTRDALRNPNPPRTRSKFATLLVSAPCSGLRCKIWHRQVHVPLSCNLAYTAA